MEKADIKSLEDIFKDTQIKISFKEHLAQHFLVEEFFFLEKVSFNIFLVYVIFQLLEFKSEPKLQIGRAVIMYQKFIKHGAFLDLRLPRDTYAKIEEICNDEQQAMTSGTITDTFFDP